MRSCALLLLLSAGTLAFAQTAPAPGGPPSAPGRLFRIPQLAPGQPQRFRLFGNQTFRPEYYVLPKRGPLDLDADRGIIRRPPAGSFAPQQPHTPMAHNLYPDLQLLPIECTRLEPIPITWPGFRMEPIPITWPDVKAVPVKSARR